MAHSTTNTFKNAIQGIPGVGFDFDVFDSHTTPKFTVGHRYTRSDGNEYVYSHFGTAVYDGGMIVGPDMTESGFTRRQGILASGSVTAISGETINPNAVGSRFVQIYLSSVTADQYAGGYFQIDGNAAAVGHFLTYRVKGNTASAALTSGAANTVYIELYEPLLKLIGAGQVTFCRIVGSRFANLESISALGDGVNTDSMVAGISTRSHAASAYGWVQVRGLGGVRTDNPSVGKGSALAISLAASGAALASYAAAAAGGHGGFGSRQIIIGTCVDSSIAGAVNLCMAHLQLG